jgi:hypothetical protein
MTDKKPIDKKSEERLIAYLLDDLSVDERAQVEAELRADGQLAEELLRLKECLQASAPEPEVSPPQLTRRTCWLVQCAIDQAKAFRGNAPVSLGESQDPVVCKSRWSFLDMVAGAAILVALAGLLMPALRESRDSARRVHCEENLRKLGFALYDYTQRYRQGLPPIQEGENAGMYSVILTEWGFFTPEELAQLVVCPDTELAEKVFAGCVLIHIPTREELAASTLANSERMRRLMGGNYAYSMGFVDQDGNLRQTKFTGSRHIPLLSDAPCGKVAFFQSGNHGKCGQNVIFQDLSSRFCLQCADMRDKDHWFLNDNNQHQAGLHAADLVLGRSEARPLTGLSQ